MTREHLTRAAVALAFAATGHAAMAQASPPVMTDTAPPPAEQRNSNGAVLLENSPVRAQRENSVEASSARTGVGSVGQRVLRPTARSKAQAELADAQAAEAEALRRRGAGALTEK